MLDDFVKMLLRLRIAKSCSFVWWSKATLRLCVCFAVTAVTIFRGTPGLAQTVQPPNVVLIVADDLGYGEIGCYGQALIKTPNIDDLARSGMRFSDFYAGSTVCAPSRCVLMTGKHSGHCSVRGNAGSVHRDLQSLQKDELTLPKLLASRGYETTMIGKWGLGEVDQPGNPLKQGFQSYYGYLNQVHAHNYFPNKLWSNDEEVVVNQNVTFAHPDIGDNGGGYLNTKDLSAAALLEARYSPDLLIDRAISFISQQHGTPFFLYLPLTLPHANNELTSATGNGADILSEGTYASQKWPPADRRHAAMISKLDEGVGKVMKQLQRQSLDQTTLVLFTSDNGPHKESNQNPERFQSAGFFRGMKRSLTEGGIRVPLIASWKGKIAPGTMTDQLCYAGDIFATIDEVTAKSMPIASGKSPTKSDPEVAVSSPSDTPASSSTSNADSLSIVPTLMGTKATHDLPLIGEFWQRFQRAPLKNVRSEQQINHQYIYWEFYEEGSRAAVRFRNWKLIEEPMMSDNFSLYDLSDDLNESKDRLKLEHDIAAEGIAYLREAHVDDPRWQELMPAKATGQN